MLAFIIMIIIKSSPQHSAEDICIPILQIRKLRQKDLTIFLNGYGQSVMETMILTLGHPHSTVYKKNSMLLFIIDSNIWSWLYRIQLLPPEL